MLNKIDEIEITSFEGFAYAGALMIAVFNTASDGEVMESDLFKVALAMRRAEGTDNEQFLRQAWDRIKGDNNASNQYQWQMREFVERFRARFFPDLAPLEAIEFSEKVAEESGIAIPRILGRGYR